MENKTIDGGHFEPSYEWQHEEGFDLLLVHLPEFKDKQGPKVQVSNCGVVKISGDRQVNQTRLRFLKEIRVQKDHNTDEIKAKLDKGILKITLPKKLTITVVAIVLVVSALSGLAYYIFTSTIVKD
ncbi:unnamed protein product [Withania somnifera]